MRRARPGPDPADVLLVSMPFGPVFWPSLGLSLLKAQLARQGATARVRYFTIAFAELIGQDLYEKISMSSTMTVRELAGEWVFSGALFDQSPADVDRYVERILIRREGYLTAEAPVPAALVTGLLRARARTGPFLDRCVADVVATRPAVVGFTSVFQQHVASLALARRLKQASPGTFIVFGGANCEGVMGAETLRQFPWVDAVVSGEADLVFPELVRRVLAGAPASDLQGVQTRSSLPESLAQHRFPSAAPVRQLDDLPYPDYEEYFAQFRASRFNRGWHAGLFVETSRGCWWGERMHCTFCGLNGATMTYRSKSAPRALDELTALASRYPKADIQVVDNILDLGYLKTLLPELAARKLDFGLFYETKSNLKKDHVRLLRAAGVRTIQPGIESFSDEILKLMRKGVTGLQNIQVLKWCKQFGVEPLWNLMWGFPREPPREYESMTRLVPLLAHLPPPAGSFGLRLDRFSPNFDEAEKFGFTDVAPLPAYAHVYGLPATALANLAYYFQFSYPETHPESYVRPLLQALKAWRRRYRTSDLFSVDVGERLLIWDLRPGRRARLTVLGDLDRLIYQMCDAVCGQDSIVELASTHAGRRGGPEAVAATLARLVGGGLMLRSGQRYLSLAVPLGDYQPSATVMTRFDAIARRQGYRSTRSTRARTSVKLTADDFSLGRHGELVIG